MQEFAGADHCTLMGAPTFDHWHSPSCTRLLFLLLSCVSFIVAGCWNPILSMSSYISRPRTWYSHNASCPTIRRSASALTPSALMRKFCGQYLVFHWYPSLFVALCLQAPSPDQGKLVCDQEARYGYQNKGATRWQGRCQDPSF